MSLLGRGGVGHVAGCGVEPGGPDPDRRLRGGVSHDCEVLPGKFFVHLREHRFHQGWNVGHVYVAIEDESELVFLVENGSFDGLIARIGLADAVEELDLALLLGPGRGSRAGGPGSRRIRSSIRLCIGAVLTAASDEKQTDQRRREAGMESLRVMTQNHSQTSAVERLRESGALSVVLWGQPVWVFRIHSLRTASVPQVTFLRTEEAEG